MISKGRETKETMSDKDFIITVRLFHYAEEIEKRLEIVDEMKGVEKMETKYAALNWMLGEIAAAYSETLDYYRTLSEKEQWDYQYFSLLDEEEYNSLEGMLSAILNMQGEEKSWYWEKKHHDHCMAEVNMYYLVCRLRGELMGCYRLLESVGRRPEQPICWPRREDKTQMPQPTHKALMQKNQDHICVDRETAGKLYKALGPNGVRWLADDIEETTFINRLTLPPTEEKIMLNHTNQVNYVTKNVLFADKKRMSPDDWNLIMRIFDAKKGNIMDVNRRDKTPQNYEKFRELMGI